MGKIKWATWFCMLLAAAPHCRDKFNASVTFPSLGYLVVEGFINSGPGPTNIRLSRALRLTDTTDIQAERQAQVRIEGDDNSLYTLTEQGNGNYSIGSLALNSGSQFRLHISTADRKEYYSDFSTVRRTPPIDSVAWQRAADGINITVHSHDPANQTHYYNWDYQETWEIHSTYLPYVKYKRDFSGRIIGFERIHPDRSPDTNGVRCWQSAASAIVLTGSSVKLSADIIDHQLTFIPNANIRLGVLYSINVHQQALSARGYDFYQRLKKNSEQTGSIFDSQPSQLNSNIHNVTDPKELVYGFMEVSELQSMRIFISAAEVTGWGYDPVCTTFNSNHANNPDSLAQFAQYYPIDGKDSMLSTSTPSCVDCRVAGSNVKPDYWPR